MQRVSAERARIARLCTSAWRPAALRRRGRAMARGVKGRRVMMQVRSSCVACGKAKVEIRIRERSDAALRRQQSRCRANGREAARGSAEDCTRDVALHCANTSVVATSMKIAHQGPAPCTINIYAPSTRGETYSKILCPAAAKYTVTSRYAIHMS